MSPALWEKNLTSLFILGYLYQAGLLAMAFPPERPTDGSQVLLKPILPVIRFLGIYHYQRWFSPNPTRLAVRVGVELYRSEGHPVPWNFPRERMSWLDPPGSYRRYVTRYVLRSHNPEVLRDLTRYIVRNNPGSVPVGVRIFKAVGAIPPPDGGGGFPVFRHPQTVDPIEGTLAPGELHPSETLETEPVPPEDP